MPSRGKEKKNRNILTKRKEKIRIINKIVKPDWWIIFFICIITFLAYIGKNVFAIYCYSPLLYLFSNLVIIAVMITVFSSTLPQIRKHKQLEEKCKDDIEKEYYDYANICTKLKDLKYSRMSKLEFFLICAISLIIFISVAIVAGLTLDNNINQSIYVNILTYITDSISAISIISVFVYIHITFKTYKVLAIYMTSIN